MLKFKSYRTGTEAGVDFLKIEMVLTIPVEKANGFEVIQLSSFLLITADTVDYIVPDDEDVDQLPPEKSILQTVLIV